MSLLRYAFNAIYILAFASSVAVAVKEIQHSANHVPTNGNQAHAAAYHPGTEAGMVHKMVASR